MTTELWALGGAATAGGKVARRLLQWCLGCHGAFTRGGSCQVLGFDSSTGPGAWLLPEQFPGRVIVQKGLI